MEDSSDLHGSTSPAPSVPPGRAGIEGRRAKRRPFPFQQRVAFGVWDTTPPDNAFVDVAFHDVSASGCSFFMESKPEVEQLRVQLGTESHRLFVEAEVVHATPHQDEFGAAFLIGCRFLKRVE